VWALRVNNVTREIAAGPSSGTSFATACVAGAIATWLAYHGRDALIARYGAANLARVAKDLLRSVTERNGEAGPLDIDAFLAAPLPDPVLPESMPEVLSEDPVLEAAGALGLESTAPGASAADELRFRMTVAALRRTAPAVGDAGLEALESAEPEFPMSAHLARLLGKD
jgi:hypothetical protein